MVERMSDIKQSDNQNNQNNCQAVYSINMATSLVADFPYFADLVSIRKNHKYPNRRVWLFKRSPEFDQVFEELKNESIKKRREIENEFNTIG